MDDWRNTIFSMNIFPYLIVCTAGLTDKLNKKYSLGLHTFEASFFKNISYVIISNSNSLKKIIWIFYPIYLKKGSKYHISLHRRKETFCGKWAIQLEQGSLNNQAL